MLPLRTKLCVHMTESFLACRAQVRLHLFRGTFPISSSIPILGLVLLFQKLFIAFITIQNHLSFFSFVHMVIH